MSHPNATMETALGAGPRTLPEQQPLHRNAGAANMAIDEHTRHHIHEWAKATWDDQAADGLMELLPPVGWADVATKRDLETLAYRLEAHLKGWFTTTLIAALGVQTAVIGIVIGVSLR